MSDPEQTIDRRKFLAKSAALTGRRRRIRQDSSFV